MEFQKTSCGDKLVKGSNVIPQGAPVLVTLRGVFDSPSSSNPDAAFVTVYDNDGDSLFAKVPVSSVTVTSPDVQAGQMYRMNGSTFVITRNAPISEGGQLVVTNVLTGDRLTPVDLVGAKLLADHENLV